MKKILLPLSLLFVSVAGHASDIAYTHFAHCTFGDEHETQIMDILVDDRIDCGKPSKTYAAMGLETADPTTSGVDYPVFDGAAGILTKIAGAGWVFKTTGMDHFLITIRYDGAKAGQPGNALAISTGNPPAVMTCTDTPDHGCEQ